MRLLGENQQEKRSVVTKDKSAAYSKNGIYFIALQKRMTCSSLWAQREASEPPLRFWSLAYLLTKSVSKLSENTLEIAAEHRQHKLTSGCREKAVSRRDIDSHRTRVQPFEL